MPKAVVSQDTERFDLKTLDGAFVELRRLSYGEMLRSRDQAQSIRPTGDEGDNGQGEMEGVFHISKVTEFRFSKAIMDHNLEDESGRKLNLSSKQDLVRLDPRIGGEIEDLIIAMNEPPTKEEGEPSFPGPSGVGDSAGKAGSAKGS